MLFEAVAARNLKCPVLVFSAGKVFRPEDKNQADLIMKAFGGQAEEKSLKEFTAEDFLAKCPPSFDEPTAACGKAETLARETRENAFLAKAVKFLMRALALD